MAFKIDKIITYNSCCNTIDILIRKFKNKISIKILLIYFSKTFRPCSTIKTLIKIGR